MSRRDRRVCDRQGIGSSRVYDVSDRTLGCIRV